MSRHKKLVSVLTFTSITSTKEKDAIILEIVPCIHYTVHLQNGDKEVTKTLINSDSKINALTTVYPKPLDLQICPTNVGAQKIDSLSLETFKIVIIGFQVLNKLGRARFF